MTDDEIKGLRKELKIKDVIISDKTSSGKLIRKQNELLYNALCKTDSILRTHALGDHVSTLEEKYRLIDLAKTKIAEEEFMDSPKRQRLGDAEPVAGPSRLRSNAQTESVEDIVAKSAAKVIEDILDTRYATTETKIINKLETFNEDISNKIDNLAGELHEHTRDEMIRMSKTATGDYSQLLHYPPINELKINFKSRPTEVDRALFNERLYRFHHHVRLGHFTRARVIAGNAKWINYREAGTGETLGNIIEFADSYNDDVRPHTPRGRNSSGGNNEGPGHGLDLDGDGNVEGGNDKTNDLDGDGLNGNNEAAAADGDNVTKVELPGLAGSMTFKLPDVHPKDYDEPVRSFIRRFLQRRLRRMKVAAQIEEDILVMQAIRNAFKDPEDVPPEMRAPMPYGFHEYAKKDKGQDDQESYLEFDGFQTNSWVQKDYE